MTDSAFHDKKLTDKMPVIVVETLNMARYATHSSDMQVQDIFEINICCICQVNGVKLADILF